MIRLCQNDCLASENLIADDDPAISPIVLDCSDDLLNRMYANGRMNGTYTELRRLFPCRYSTKSAP